MLIMSVAMASDGESVGSDLLVVKSSSNASVISMAGGSDGSCIRGTRIGFGLTGVVPRAFISVPANHQRLVFELERKNWALTK